MSDAGSDPDADSRDDYARLRDTGDWVPPGLATVTVAGPDAGSYLQGQLSQDVAGLAVGAGGWSLLLEPSGKLGSWVHVRRAADDRFVLGVEAVAVESVLARLHRFKLRTDATITSTDVEPGTAGPAFDDDAARIEAGVPRAGAEITDDVIPAELGQWLIDRSVSFTKGCYTGQELVARIDSRGGNVPRQLRGLLVVGDQVPAVGAEIVVDGTVVGTVTSAAHSGRLAAPVALGFVKRAIEPPAAAVVTWDGGSVAAEIRALPLLAGPS